MSQSIQPLRVQKGTPGSAVAKMPGGPLAELSPMERRRNSPSFNQNTKKQLLDSSPFDSSPFAVKFNGSPLTTDSPHSKWQGRGLASPTRLNESRDASPSPAKRSSIENLKRASRVKNSTMFAREQKQEYDPASAPLIERPLASGRPLSGLRGNDTQVTSPTVPTAPCAPETDFQLGMASPGKSSLSKNSRYGSKFDPENGIWSEEDDALTERQLPAGKALHRHAKSVTFDAAPPQVNEYEMTTPAPSSLASGSREGSYDSIDDEDESFDRGSSVDRDESFDASLEDTEKTPVVLPDDWRFMSPELAKDDLTARMDDPFNNHDDSAPHDPVSPIDDDDLPSRMDSVSSSGDRRPLPPLPPAESSGSPGFQSTLERINSTHRGLPSPPRPASVSKAELQAMTGSSMGLEDRLRLMMIQEGDRASASKLAAEEQRERRLRRGAASPDRSPERPGSADTLKDVQKQDPMDTASPAKGPPRISRESILRKVKSKNLRENFEGSSPARSLSPEDEFEDAYDPDIPLPSLEEREAENVPAVEDDVTIKQEDEDTVNFADIPEAPAKINAIDSGFDFGLPKPIDQPVERDDDDGSQYSTDIADVPAAQPASSKDQIPDCLKIGSGKEADATDLKKKHRLSFAHFSSGLEQEDFGASFSTYLTARDDNSTIQPPMASIEEKRPERQSFAAKDTSNLYDGSGYGNDEDYEEPSTPQSVIRRSLSDYSDIEELPEPVISPEPAMIPEPAATIKAPGGQLKTRASLAPADVKTMAETRRQVSGESGMGMPPVPDRARNRPSVIPEGDSFMPETSFSAPDGPEDQTSMRRRTSLVQLDVTMEEHDEGLSFGIDKEFDRLAEARKNGYLMRQNTKVVVASSASTDSSEGPTRATKSAGNSPVKRNNSNAWTTEPWNGKARRRSIRQSAGGAMKRPAAGAVPPLPGMPSNVTTESDLAAEPDSLQESEEFDEAGERGRLFVKVVGVKDLDLQFPRDERTYFALTLDNGLHCVTTSWLELGKNAPIGQEFELVVLDELEFQLTLNTKLEPPKDAKVPDSPTKKTTKPLNLSRVFASPKKRKELEMKEKEEAQKAARQREMEARARRANPTAWDLMHKLVGDDGSFARAYISLKEHENEAYGRPYTVDVPCFNEWTIDEARSVNSARSGRPAPAAGIQRKAPYKIGKLELQLLYVPKPKEATDEDMPKSMNGCVRELSEAEQTAKVSFEGHLSQQGGDCPYWRRRFFRLDGPKLTAYHEATHQPRATINLAKARKLIDDKSALTEKEVKGKGGSRRKSAFAEEEEGYMFVEEGFRVRFSNGEVIDFYADSTADKEKWMVELAKVVGKDYKTSKSWTDMVLKREQQTASKGTKAGPNSVAMKSAPNTPASRRTTQDRPTSQFQRPAFPRPQSQQLLSRPASKDQPARPSSQQQVGRSNPNKPLPRFGARDPRRTSQADRRQKTRSMIF